MKDYIFIFFHGMGSEVNDGFSTYLINNIKKIGKVYTYTTKYNNLIYYMNYKNYSNKFNDNINFNMEYLDCKKHCEMIFKDVKKKFKNVKNNNLIILSHSLGNLYGVVFTKLFTKYVLLHVAIDPMLVGKPFLTFNKKYPQPYQKYNINKLNDEFLKEKQSEIKKEKNKKLKKKYAIDLYYYCHKYIAQYHKKIDYDELFVKTIFIKNYDLMNIKNIKQIDKDFLDTHNKFIQDIDKNNKNIFDIIYFIDKGHFLHHHKNVANKIINYINGTIDKEYNGEYHHYHGLIL